MVNSIASGAFGGTGSKPGVAGSKSAPRCLEFGNPSELIRRLSFHIGGVVCVEKKSVVVAHAVRQFVSVMFPSSLLGSA